MSFNMNIEKNPFSFIPIKKWGFNTRHIPTKVHPQRGLFLFIVKVVLTCPELAQTDNPLASISQEAGITTMPHHARPHDFILAFTFIYLFDCKYNLLS